MGEIRMPARFTTCITIIDEGVQMPLFE